MSRQCIHPLERKLRILLWHHRKHVFNETTGDLHERAIKRLKKTKVFDDITRERHRRSTDRILEVHWM